MTGRWAGGLISGFGLIGLTFIPPLFTFPPVNDCIFSDMVFPFKSVPCHNPEICFSSFQWQFEKKDRQDGLYSA